MDVASRDRSRDRILGLLESFRARGGYMVLQRTDDVAQALDLSPEEIEELCERYPFYRDWRRDLRRYYDRMEAALDDYGDADHPAVRVAEAELEIEYARLAERYGLRAARWDGTTGQMVPTTWDVDIEETRERLAQARAELEGSRQ
jgi:hypothetical protein